jgi:carbamoyl-phosphate synthase small subunit
MEGRGILALEEGSVFVGRAFGARCTTVAEVVFNTSMTGYQEVITDPSYFGQIVAMTCPHIGNVGVNPEDMEGQRPYVSGLVVAALSPVTSSWRSVGNLAAYLEAHGVPGLSGVDTRTLTRTIRAKGAMRAVLSTEPEANPIALVEMARAWRGLEGVDREKAAASPWLQPRG